MVSRPTDRCYVHNLTGQELMRTTQFIKGGETLDLSNTPWWGATHIGTACDQMCRDYFVEGPHTLSYDNYSKHLSQDAYNQLLEALYEVKKSIGDEWMVYADRVFLYSEKMGVAGEVDLILVNFEEEKVVIVDMKTCRNPKSLTPGSKKMKGYNRQLNVYRAMAEELMDGHPVEALSIFPIHVDYAPHSAVTSQAKMLPWITVEQRDVSAEIEETWMTRTGMGSAEYMEKASAEKNEFDAWLDELNSL